MAFSNETSLGTILPNPAHDHSPYESQIPDAHGASPWVTERSTKKPVSEAYLYVEALAFSHGAGRQTMHKESSDYHIPPVNVNTAPQFV
jgi:hypothetical protein